MPRSNHLPFLRPLYDIAAWQFILMIGTQSKLKFTYKMHKVVANFVCKLLETRPFSHLKDKMMEEEIKAVTDNWVPGERATGRLVEWCQDQWRRKEPCYPEKSYAYSVNVPSTLPWYVDMPVCFNCGVPCPECRTELGLDMPAEMSNANAILHFAQERQINVTDEEDCLEDNGTRQLASSQQPPSRQETAVSRMTLRSSRKRN